jgi:DNA repair protein RadA/Sms
LSDIPDAKQERFATGLGEFNRVLAGGSCRSVVLSAEARFRKSTFCRAGGKGAVAYGGVLYVSGEESAAQIKLRATRLGIADGISLMAETELGSILSGVEMAPPRFLVVDSIQTLYDANLSSAPGSVSQVRGCATKITLWRSRWIWPTFIIGH